MNGFWYTDPSQDRPTSIATGEAPLSEIYRSATDQMRLVENQNAQYEALTRAFDNRVAAVEAATGEKLPNPMRTANEADRQLTELTLAQGGVGSAGLVDPYRLQPDALQAKIDEFQKTLGDVAQRHPDKAAIIGADRPVDRDAAGLAQVADEKLATAMASRSGLGKWGAALAGGFVGSGYDPIQVGTLLIGGGPGAARTVAGRLLTTVASEAAVNALAEAVQQPTVQAWRRQVGLPNGPDEAIKNIAFAGALGGAFGGVIGGVGEIAGRLMRGSGEDAARLIAERPETSPTLKAAIDGDPTAAAELLHPIRAELPAEARGAIDAIAADREMSALRPAAVSAAVHDDAMASALQAVQSGGYFLPEPDPEQVARLVDRLVPAEAPVAAVKDAEPTLEQFLMRAGGVQDFKGELDALGLTNRSERFTGKLVKADGMPLDQARLRAAEAGYFNDLYGTPDEAAARSTIPDLLDKLDQGQRGADTAPSAGADRAYAESLVYDIARQAGPAVDDELILKATQLAAAEKITPVEALDRVLIADDMDKEKLRMASEPAGVIDPNDTRGGIDNPASMSEDMMISNRDLAALDDDFEIPFFDDDAPISVRDLRAELEKDDDLIALVEACRA